ncbi:MAG: hypothetical protein V4689_19200 [Verrucomicrobiota bacterium]
MSIIGLVMVVIPFVQRQRVKAIQTYAVGNSRQLGMCLYEFESDYGKFPDASTITAVKAKSGSLLPLGIKTSNDYFRQLLASGIVQGESFFYADIADSRKPDDRMEPGRAIEKGECGYCYLMGLSSKGNPSRPIAVTPLIPGTDRFDPKPFGRKAVLLMLDNSVTSRPIQKDGHVLMNGKNVFDPTNPIWDGKPPVIVWPE